MAALPDRKIPIPAPPNFGWDNRELVRAGYALLVDEIASRRAETISEALNEVVKVYLRGVGDNKGLIQIGPDSAPNRIYPIFNRGTYKLANAGTDDNRLKEAITAAFGEGVTPEEFESVKTAVKAKGIPHGVELDRAVLGTAQKGGARGRRHRKSRKASRKSRKTHRRRRA